MKKLMQLLAVGVVVLLSTWTAAEARRICASGNSPTAECHIQCEGDHPWDLDMTAQECCHHFRECCNSEGYAYFGDPQTGSCN
ncbi:MAG TPA: hypothetical protein VEL74_05055 [Thermoanaerobaculia bacterium]|nr:hypothetical protein [Thermoanaerobaculia bacterium]